MAEAEPVLQEAGEDAISWTKMEPPHQRRTFERLARFYTDWNKAAPNTAKSAKATEWEKRLAELDVKLSGVRQ
jgi:hypothetical protein